MVLAECGEVEFVHAGGADEGAESPIYGYDDEGSSDDEGIAAVPADPQQAWWATFPKLQVPDPPPT